MKLKTVSRFKFSRKCFLCVAFILIFMAGIVVYAAVKDKPISEHLKKSESFINIKDKGAIGDGAADDTEVIRKTLESAKSAGQTVYFPAGTYIVTESVKLEQTGYGQSLSICGESAENTKIVGSSSLSGAVIDSDMNVGFSISDISIEHQGTGSCIDAWDLRALRCTFTSYESNKKDLVVFTGSNCRVTSCTFNGSNTYAYALRHTKMPDRGGQSGIAINSFIIDNTFQGSSRGILVNRAPGEEHRIEGLKINGNTFTNTGSEQITVETILHIDISNNKMSGSSGSAIVMDPKGVLVDGMYVCSNDIQAAEACIYEPENTGYSTRINYSNNVMHDSAYGILSNSRIGSLTIDNNTMTNIKKAGIMLVQTDELIITENRINVNSGADTICIASADANTIITSNTLSGKINNKLNGGKSIIKSNILSE